MTAMNPSELNGHNTAPPPDHEERLRTMLVPISGAEAAVMLALASFAEAAVPLSEAFGFAGFAGYATVCRQIYERWVAEVGRPIGAPS